MDTGTPTTRDRDPLPQALLGDRHRADVIYVLTRVGSFTEADATIYADGWRCRPDPNIVLTEAIAYDNLGLTASEAITWHQHGFYATETKHWLQAGYTPTQAAQLVLLASEGDINEWLNCALTPDQVLGLAHAGIHPWEANDVLNDPAMTPDTLPMLAALLTSNGPR